MTRYFISHSAQDRKFVEEYITDLLKALGIQYWYSIENIKTGDDWGKSIESGLESSDGIILIMSPFSAVSEWVKKEINWGMINRPERLIPILYKSCNLDSFHSNLSKIQYIDFTNSKKRAQTKLTGFLNDIEHDANSRINIMNGHWKGSVHQHQNLNIGPIDYFIEIDLKVSRQCFEGSIKILTSDIENSFKLTGGFFYERFIEISYRSTDSGLIQFGSAVLELDSSGKHMNGKWVGFGAISQTIVDGTVSIIKVQI